MTPVEAQRLLDAFMADRAHDARYASFDYCYGYFQTFRRAGRVRELCEAENLRRSCLELGFYLASWGMFRASGDLLNKSFRALTPVVKAVAEAPASVWDLDVDRYSDGTWNLIKAERLRLSKALNLRNPASDILLTKIMMGVYGNVPAFDRFMTTGLKLTMDARMLGQKSITALRDFYAQHSALLDAQQISLLSFDGGITDIMYPKAKLVDMILFMRGLEESGGDDERAAAN